MANEQQQQPQKPTASQRIDSLENGLGALFQTADNLARDMMIVKDAIKLLGNKLDAVVKLSNREVSQNINDDAIAKIMIENNVADLKEKVTGLVSQGVLVASEEITDNSFVVGEELDNDGNVVNPRLQFALNAINEDLKTKIKAAKIGEAILLQEGKSLFKVLESYSIQQPQPAPAQEQSPAASQPADSAPAQDQSAAPAPAPADASAAPADAQSSSNDSAQSAPAGQSQGS